MTQMTRWNPFSEFENILDRYNRQFPRNGNGNSDTLRKADWAPAVDIAENDEAFLITAELPGVTKEDIKVSVHDGVLTLEGERRFEKRTDNDKQHRVERFYGQFVRSFSLPDNVDEENIQANFSNGVLELTLTKQEKAKPKSIEVNVS